MYIQKNSAVHYIYYLIMKFKYLQSGFNFYIQQVVQMKNFMRVLFKLRPAPEYYGMPRLIVSTCTKAMQHVAAQQGSTFVRKTNSACSVVITARAAVL